MDALTYITQRQRAWACRHRIEHNNDGWTPHYTANLFQSLSDDACQESGAGAGGELGGKMRALHSSSAIACNVFHHWKARPIPTSIFGPCGLEVSATDLCSLRFEQIFPVKGIVGTPPHLDVVLQSSKDRVIAIESKFREPHDKHQEVIQQQYFNAATLWTTLPNLLKFARQVASGEVSFEHPQGRVASRVSQKHRY